MSPEGFTAWFTGLSGSGKSTLAAALRDRLQELGHHVELLDSGRLRRELNRSLGWSREEIESNLKRLGYEAKMLNRNGVVVLVSAVSPYRDVRDAIREDVGRFIEVYCRCPMEVLLKRDDQGLFERASRGEWVIAGHLAALRRTEDPWEYKSSGAYPCSTGTQPVNR